MKRHLIIVSVLGLLASLVACDGQFAFFGSPTQTQVQGAVPSPTPTPTPTVFATPDPCRIESVKVDFYAEIQTPFLNLGQTVQIDATPFNSSGPVTDGCQASRSVFWSVSTPTTCQVIGSGFVPFLRGLKVGSCSLTATVENVVSAPFSVEVR